MLFAFAGMILFWLLIVVSLFVAGAVICWEIWRLCEPSTRWEGLLVLPLATLAGLLLMLVAYLLEAETAYHYGICFGIGFGWSGLLLIIGIYVVRQLRKPAMAGAR
jgi:hypothetical protein